MSDKNSHNVVCFVISCISICFCLLTYLIYSYNMKYLEKVKSINKNMLVRPDYTPYIFDVVEMKENEKCPHN